MNTAEASNPIGCACRLTAHKSCFDQWFVTRQHMECPICHTISFPYRIPDPETYVVYINMTQANANQDRARKVKEQVAIVFCCTMMGWAIGLGIMQAIALQ